MDSSAAAASTSGEPRRLDNALLNQSLDDIIKQNRAARSKDRKPKSAGSAKNKASNRNMMVDTNGSGSSKGGRVQKRKSGPNSNNTSNRNSNNNATRNSNTITSPSSTTRRSRDSNSNNNNRRKDRGLNGGKVLVRSNFGRAGNGRSNGPRSSSASSTPGLRQPWERLPVAPLPAEPLKISIRNELATRAPASHNPSAMVMDTDMPMSSSSHSQSHYHHRAAAPLSAPGPVHVYEQRDALASRDEYRLGNRFSTQGMTIDYQLPSGASYDTRPTRRF